MGKSKTQGKNSWSGRHSPLTCTQVMLKKMPVDQGCINRPRIGEDFSSETSLPSFPHIGNVGITRKTMESTAELILCGS